MRITLRLFLLNLEKLISIRFDEFYSYLRSPFNPSIKNSNNFVIFSSNRTGSTLLSSLLKSHPLISSNGEIFLKFRIVNFQKVLFPKLYIKGLKTGKNKSFCFELKTQHIKSVFLKKNINMVQDLYNNGWKIIYLKRLNIFRQATSHLIAAMTSQWHNFPDKPLVKEKVHINCEKLLQTIKWLETLELEEKKILKDLEYKTIYYESDLLEESNHQITCNSIANYIGIESMEVNSEIKKISSNKLSDQILNYDEVENFFKNTKYSEFI